MPACMRMNSVYEPVNNNWLPLTERNEQACIFQPGTCTLSILQFMPQWPTALLQWLITAASSGMSMFSCDIEWGGCSWIRQSYQRPPRVTAKEQRVDEKPRLRAAVEINLLLCNCFHGNGGRWGAATLQREAMLYIRWGEGFQGGAGVEWREKGILEESDVEEGKSNLEEEHCCTRGQMNTLVSFICGTTDAAALNSSWSLQCAPTCSVGMWAYAHTHTHLRDTFCIIKGYLKVILNRNCHTSIIRTSSPLMLQLTFISLSFGYTHTHRNSSSRWNTRGFFSI